MRHNPFFKLLCTIVLSLYGVTAAQAGQVITQDERQWAKKILEQEAHLGTIESSNSVAILNFHNKTEQKRLNAMQKGLALMLITDLSKIKDIFVIERIRIQALIDEMHLDESGLIDDKTAPEVGKFLKAYYVVNGSILEGSIDELEVNTSVLDVPFEDLSTLPATQGNMDELFRMEKEILFSIIDEIKIYVSPEKKKELMKPLSLNTAALLALFLGIDYSDKGQYAEATEMYNRAIAEDPNLQLARDSLQELNDMGLITANGVSREESEPEAPPEDGESGIGTVVGVGLALAAIAGGALALSGGGSDGSGSSSDDTSSDDTGDDTSNTTTDTVTVSPLQTSASCDSGQLVFNFSVPMNTSVGTITTNPALSYFSWEWNYTTSQSVAISWSYAYDTLDCGGTPQPFTVYFSDFMSSGDAPQSLSGQTYATVTTE